MNRNERKSGEKGEGGGDLSRSIELVSICVIIAFNRVLRRSFSTINCSFEEKSVTKIGRLNRRRNEIKINFADDFDENPLPVYLTLLS